MAVLDYRAVLLRLQDEIPFIDIDAQRARLRRLIEDNVKKYKQINEYPIKYWHIKVEDYIDNGVICLPCDMFRPLRQWHDGVLLEGRDEWRIMGDKVFPKKTKGDYKLSYYSVSFIEDEVEGQMWPINDWEVDVCAYRTAMTILQTDLADPSKAALYSIMQRKAKAAAADANSLRNKTISEMESVVDILRFGNQNRI